MFKYLLQYVPASRVRAQTIGTTSRPYEWEVQESIKCGSSMVQEQQRIGRKIVLVRSAERCMHTATRLAHSKHRQRGDTRSPRPSLPIQSPMDVPRPRRFTRVSFTRGVTPKECVLRQAAAASEVHGPRRAAGATRSIASCLGHTGTRPTSTIGQHIVHFTPAAVSGHPVANPTLLREHRSLFVLSRPSLHHSA